MNMYWFVIRKTHTTNYFFNSVPPPPKSLDANLSPPQPLGCPRGILQAGRRRRKEEADPTRTPSCRLEGEVNTVLPPQTTSSKFRARSIGIGHGAPPASLPGLAASPLAHSKTEGSPNLSSICPQQLDWQLGPGPGQYCRRNPINRSQPQTVPRDHHSVLPVLSSPD